MTRRMGEPGWDHNLEIVKTTIQMLINCLSPEEQREGSWKLAA